MDLNQFNKIALNQYPEVVKAVDLHANKEFATTAVKIVKTHQYGNKIVIELVYDNNEIHPREVYICVIGYLKMDPFSRVCHCKLDSEKNVGTHWVAYRKSGFKVIYFDSFGDLPPPRELMNVHHDFLCGPPGGETVKLKIPTPKKLPWSEVKLSYYFIGDGAYPLREYLMKPIRGQRLTKKENNYNFRVSRARCVVENTFGRISKKWEILQTTIQQKPENVEKVIKGICILNNILMDKQDKTLTNYAEYVEDEEVQEEIQRQYASQHFQHRCLAQKGRGQSSRQTSRTDRRPGSGANSDMSLDASTSTSPGQTPRYQPPPLRVDNASGDSRTLKTLVITMIEENRRRDQQRDAMIERLFMQLSMNTTAPRAGENTAPAATAEAPVQSYQVMPDLTKNIENFTGDESPAEAREWISNIQSMLLLHHWPEEFALETARMHLVRGARDWFSARRRLVDTWPKFQEAFQTTYVRQDTMVCRWKRMTECAQKKDESLQQYFHNKVKLCADLRLNTQETKEQVLVGLWSKDLFNAMSARSHADVDALLHDMLDYEYRVGQRQERIRSVNASANPRGQQSGVETKSNGDKSSRNANERPQRQPSRNEKGEPRCFNCQAYGHFSKDCREPRKEPYCVGCRTAGHYEKDCQNAVNEISNGREEAR
ncbi:unnamed protein product [Trichogramma brassicae]|uniref:CCHC-type domain-containing protein n=1 Tax=Trichogramma brassicae TaxID=86971 RepID=A0A6H5IDN1_9HYME|nr:unnamed protein product [Trichogramma brassicae]